MPPPPPRSSDTATPTASSRVDGVVCATATSGPRNGPAGADAVPSLPLIVALAAVPLGLSAVLIAASLTWPIALLAWLPGLFVLPAVESLCLTPLYERSGRFRRWSRFLYSTGDVQRGIDLHLGTLYDYVRYLSWRRRGAANRRAIVRDLGCGLRAIADAVETGALPASTPVRITTWFVGARSLARLGCAFAEPTSFERFNLATVSFSLSLRLAFTRGRIAWPDLSNVRCGVTTAGAIAALAAAPGMPGRERS